MAFCPRCGKDVAGNSSCPYCGTTIIEQDPGVTSQLAAFQAARARATARELAEKVATAQAEARGEDLSEEAKEREYQLQAAQVAAEQATRAIEKMNAAQLASYNDVSDGQNAPSELNSLKAARAKGPTELPQGTERMRKMAASKPKVAEETDLMSAQFDALGGADGSNPFEALPSLAALARFSEVRQDDKPRRGSSAKNAHAKGKRK